MSIRQNNRYAADTFLKNIVNFIKIFLVFFAPFVILHYSFWNNDANIQKVINRFSLTGFVLIDDTINYALFVYFLFYLAALVKSVDAAVRGGDPGLRTSYRKTFSVFGSYLWVKILALFKILCWALLLLVPGVIALVTYNFSGMALLVDGKRGKEAIMASHRIIRANAWAYLRGFVVMASVLIAGCVSATIMLNNYITYFALRGQTVFQQAFIYVEIIIYALSLSYFITYYYYMYLELKDERKG